MTERIGKIRQWWYYNKYQLYLLGIAFIVLPLVACIGLYCQNQKRINFIEKYEPRDLGQGKYEFDNTLFYSKRFPAYPSVYVKFLEKHPELSIVEIKPKENSVVIVTSQRK